MRHGKLEVSRNVVGDIISVEYAETGIGSISRDKLIRYCLCTIMRYSSLQAKYRYMTLPLVNHFSQGKRAQVHRQRKRSQALQEWISSRPGERLFVA
jgi:hypothetical protein